MNTDAERFACKIRLRAERRAGEMLGELEREPGKRTDTTSGHAEPRSEFAQAKEDAGVSDSQAKRWQDAAIFSHLLAALVEMPADLRCCNTRSGGDTFPIWPKTPLRIVQVGG